ncbi:MAG: phosphoribosyl-ATP pyrophosphohydrolase [Candidatus Saccharibacteria bacterium]|nr:phosphoribosyl-ATP pyrophosphohydrolase [Candidatus Saccharibacteria bacterium]
MHADTNLPADNQYPKLVRDKIPEIVESQGKKAKIKVLTDDNEYLEALLSKLIEEANELALAETEENQAEELADVMEVIESILILKRLSLNDIAQVQEQKREKRGGFKERLLMDSKP